MIDWNMWILYLLYVEMGVLVGVLLKQKFVPPLRNEDGTLTYGTLGQFVLGIGVTFGFQLLGTDFMQAWAASTTIATTGNLLPVLMGRVTSALEVRRTQTSINDLKEMMVGNTDFLGNLEEFMSRLVDILATAEDARRAITKPAPKEDPPSEAIDEVKEPEEIAPTES